MAAAIIKGSVQHLPLVGRFCKPSCFRDGLQNRPTDEVCRAERAAILRLALRTRPYCSAASVSS